VRLAEPVQGIHFWKQSKNCCRGFPDIATKERERKKTELFGLIRESVRIDEGAHYIQVANFYNHNTALPN
jgi:hypothetical protein